MITPSRYLVPKSPTHATRPKLAIHGGPKAITLDRGDILRCPIVTPEDEEVVLDVLHRGAMSGNDVTNERDKLQKSVYTTALVTLSSYHQSSLDPLWFFVVRPFREEKPLPLFAGIEKTLLGAVVPRSSRRRQIDNRPLRGDISARSIL
ncbi:MAG: hypothetical protein NTW86_29995 [Candidatus Sumerlaeota bacterium]|nr:hypothetical protein [Candidatus Sumerlaeota bacterium]